ncbi:hypothetical protein FPQ18DRAFT_40717 [Pyronema domesticum]|uniref:Protein kinase domain-containing protein n=1 Tax=Pyronema omphalodes (strain CBS 100304) TaxID=1076935 RepID=U4LDR6_PYROM|nr:hypothetical protein FPQ18DRAFT_40717 [Pyronema domesticum]CCX30003.1 Similar to predicted protein [Trichoderma reesei QM6a]; acc. no. EGR52676 [Pyronema omphalodes CBS 100304]
MSAPADQLAQGITELYASAFTGYLIITEALKAQITDDKEQQILFRQVWCQRERLFCWAEHWGFNDDTYKGVRARKTEVLNLISFVESGPAVADAILSALHRISDLFTNETRLTVDFGLIMVAISRTEEELEDPDVVDILHGLCKIPFSQRLLDKNRDAIRYLSRCDWAINDIDKFYNFLIYLRNFNDELYNLCSPESRNMMNLSLIAAMLINKNDLQTLLDIHDAARRLDSEDRSSPSKGFYSRSYRKLAEAAKLRAKTKTDPHIKKRLVRPPAVLHKRDYEIFHGNGRELYWSRGNAYLAYCQRDRSMVIIEYKHYRSPELSGHTQKVHKEHILMWAEFLCADEKPSSIRMLDCTGYFHDEAEGGYGFVYELPSYMYLKHPDQLRIPETLTLRAPTDLFMLMRNKTEPISLATRVRIAQQLATSLYMIHSCGLTHQNIRPTSILFLPAESSDGTGPSRQRRCALGKPYLMGWLFDEPEDLLAEDVIGLNRAAVAMKSREYMVYQHPDTIRYYNRPYLPQYDIYSLGLILLEIGTWQNMYDQTNTSGLLSAQDLSDYVMANYVPMLAETTGKIYMEAVRKCLDITDRVKNMPKFNGKPSSEDQMLVAKMFLRDVVLQLDKIRV